MACAIARGSCGRSDGTDIVRTRLTTSSRKPSAEDATNRRALALSSNVDPTRFVVAITQRIDCRGNELTMRTSSLPEAILVALLVGRCGGGPTEIPLSSLERTVAEAACQQLATCPLVLPAGAVYAALSRHPGRTSCADLYERAAPFPVERYRSSIDAGRIVYDGRDLRRPRHHDELDARKPLHVRKLPALQSAGSSPMRLRNLHASRYRGGGPILPHLPSDGLQRRPPLRPAAKAERLSATDSGRVRVRSGQR